MTVRAYTNWHSFHCPFTLQLDFNGWINISHPKARFATYLPYYTKKNTKLYDSSLLPQLPVKHFPDYFMVSVGILRSYSRQHDINILN